jgi:hypothetical protein
MSKIELPELPVSFCKGNPTLEAIGKTIGGLYSGDVMRAYAEAAILAERKKWADALHYPECWCTTAYPTIEDAMHEALAWGAAGHECHRGLA